jgi:hypothetical protein
MKMLIGSLKVFTSLIFLLIIDLATVIWKRQYRTSAASEESEKESYLGKSNTEVKMPKVRMILNQDQVTILK